MIILGVIIGYKRSYHLLITVMIHDLNCDFSTQFPVLSCTVRLEIATAGSNWSNQSRLKVKKLVWIYSSKVSQICTEVHLFEYLNKYTVCIYCIFYKCSVKYNQNSVKQRQNEFRCNWRHFDE